MFTILRPNVPIMRNAAFFITSLLTIVGCSRQGLTPRPWTLQELEVIVTDTSREVSFTNKRAGFYVTESNAPSQSPWHGWHITSTRFMADHVVRLGDNALDRSAILEAVVRPDRLRRTYADGTMETIELVDSVDALIVTLELVDPHTVAIAPLLANVARTGLLSTSAGDVLLLANRRDAGHDRYGAVPTWLGVTTAAPGAVPDTAKAEVLIPAQRGTTTVLFVAGTSLEQVLTMITDLRTSFRDRLQRRRARMESVLNSGLFRSSNHRFDRALAWARLSLDALIMRQGKVGIFAGLPWFSNYWGRDTFISLPGATLVAGDYATSKEILRSFASWQNTDPLSPDVGRIPNLVTPTSTSYNTADGTPWFVLGIYEYVRTSGDTAFVREMFPVLRRAVEGALRHRVDRDGFLTHGDAETWMDAVGPDGPWSPRGNRANDIQALWYKQLVVSTAFAESMGESDLAERWNGLAEKVMERFQSRFVDARNGRLFDHLDPDGSADTSFRPNQLFALDIVADLDARQRIFKNITSRIVYPFGVGSLAPEDPKYHPYHQHPPFYPKDAAYHNGVVWTWLAGPWVKAAVEFGRPNLAFRVTDDLVHQLLDRGAVGTISELLDAAPRRGESEPRLSGTFSQAWSLAEFVRTLYHAYLGVSVDAPNRQLWLLPQMPMALSAAVFDVTVGDARVRVSYEGDAGRGIVTLHSLQQRLPIRVLVGWPLAGRRGRSAGFELLPGQRVRLELSERGTLTESHDPSQMSVDTEIQSLAQFPLLSELDLATPRVPADTRSLRGPLHPLLSLDDVQRLPVSPRTLADAKDPSGDDRGPGSFVYPTTAHLRDGSLDLIRFQAVADTGVVRFTLTFRALSDPGWHPEYGTQLTFIAIAVDADGRIGTGQRRVGRNARASMPDGRGYERILYVGGGVRLEDAGGAILAEYRPVDGDVRRPIGNAASGTVSFSIPQTLLGPLGPSAKWTVFIGAQDDHGGAGLGDFRAVEREAGEWHGGGRRSDSEPNVYDQLNLNKR
jgi:glycogen debranching enzyme